MWQNGCWQTKSLKSLGKGRLLAKFGGFANTFANTFAIKIFRRKSLIIITLFGIEIDR